jgi:geranylgeranyl pyrophosphate synthase
VDEVLTAYSEALGIAYQIRDDLSDLGAGGETNDIAGLRPSLMLAVAHERAANDQKTVLDAHWRRSGSADPARIESLFLELEADQRCADLLERYKEQAIRSLADLDNANLKGLLRRVLGKIFNDTEIKGWCKEVQQTAPAAEPVLAGATHP